MLRHLQGAVLAHIAHRGAECGVDRVALRRTGHVHGWRAQARAPLPGLPSRSWTSHASSERVRALGSAFPMSSEAMRTRRRARGSGGRSRRRACARASTACRRGSSPGSTCGARRSGRRTRRLPCRSAVRSRPPARAAAPPRSGCVTRPSPGPPAISSRLSARRASPSDDAGEGRAQLRRHLDSPRAEPALGVGARRAVDHGADGVLIQSLQDIDPRPRQQRVVELEGRVSRSSRR